MPRPIRGAFRVFVFADGDEAGISRGSLYPNQVAFEKAKASLIGNSLYLLPWSAEPMPLATRQFTRIPLAMVCSK